MAWNNAVVTNRGVEMLGEAAENGVLTFVSASGSDSTYPNASLMAQTAPSNEKQTFSITKISDVSGGKKLCVQITNKGLTHSYFMKQLCIWAKVNDGNPEVLAIIQDDTGILIRAEDEISDFLLKFYALLKIDNVAEMNVTVNGSSFATVAALEKHEQDAASHLTDKAQTLRGVKTFEDSPEVPEPKKDNQAAPKGYVDTALAEIDEAIHGLKTGKTSQAEFNAHKAATSQLYREVANLKLYQEASERIENGVLFGDNFVGEPMGIGFDKELSSATRDIEQQCLTFNKKRDLVTTLPLTPNYGTRLSTYSNYTWSGWSYEDDNSYNYQSIVSAVSSTLIDLTNVKSVVIDYNIVHDGHISSTNQFGFSKTNVDPQKNYAKRIYKVLTTTINGIKGKQTLDVTDLTGEYYVYGYLTHKGNRSYDCTTTMKINSAIMVTFGTNKEFAIYDLPTANEVVTFIKKVGDMDINAYANNKLMDKELVDNEFCFYTKLSKKEPVQLKLEAHRDTINETDKITRILGGINK